MALLLGGIPTVTTCHQVADLGNFYIMKRGSSSSEKIEPRRPET
jgi:hypothetical protein